MPELERLPMTITWNRDGVTLHSAELAAQMTHTAQTAPIDQREVLLRATLSVAIDRDARRVVEQAVKREAKGNK